jgi:hypothetical protein
LPGRTQLDLPKHHIVRVTYQDSNGRSLSYDYDLDLEIYEGRMSVRSYGLHDGMKALVEIEKHLRRAREGVSSGFSVWVRNGDRRDEERRRTHSERIRTMQDEKLRQRESIQPQEQSPEEG